MTYASDAFSLPERTNAWERFMSRRSWKHWLTMTAAAVIVATPFFAAAAGIPPVSLPGQPLNPTSEAECSALHDKYLNIIHELQSRGDEFYRLMLQAQKAHAPWEGYHQTSMEYYAQRDEVAGQMYAADRQCHDALTGYQAEHDRRAAEERAALEAQRKAEQDRLAREAAQRNQQAQSNAARERVINNENRQRSLNAMAAAEAAQQARQARAARAEQTLSAATTIFGLFASAAQANAERRAADAEAAEAQREREEQRRAAEQERQAAAAEARRKAEEERLAKYDSLLGAVKSGNLGDAYQIAKNDVKQSAYDSLLGSSAMAAGDAAAHTVEGRVEHSVQVDPVAAVQGENPFAITNPFTKETAVDAARSGSQAAIVNYVDRTDGLVPPAPNRAVDDLTSFASDHLPPSNPVTSYVQDTALKVGSSVAKQVTGEGDAATTAVSQLTVRSVAEDSGGGSTPRLAPSPAPSYAGSTNPFEAPQQRSREPTSPSDIPIGFDRSAYPQAGAGMTLYRASPTAPISVAPDGDPKLEQGDHLDSQGRPVCTTTGFGKVLLACEAWRVGN